MSEPTSLPGVLWAYLLERFPPAATLLYAAALFYASWGFAGTLDGAGEARILPSIAGAGVFFLALLHLRLMDEHKDYQDDVVAHPQRLLSRGVVTLEQLRGFLLVVLVFEAALAATLGWLPFAVWLLILGFTVAMLVEFGIGPWLERHLGWYLISHQAMVALMVLLAVVLRVDAAALTAGGWLRVAVLAGAVMSATVTFELGRKTWSPDREHAHADSYTRDWGRPRTVVTTLAVAGAGAGAWCWLLLQAGASWIPMLLVALAVVALTAVELAFLRRPVKKTSKLVELAGAVYALVGLIGCAVGFIAA